MFRNVARIKQALDDAACEHILKTALRGVLYTLREEADE